MTGYSQLFPNFKPGVGVSIRSRLMSAIDRSKKIKRYPISDWATIFANNKGS
jgi:hypothetical protein